MIKTKQCSPKVGPITVDEEASLGVPWDVMASAEHGRQHGVLVAPQSGQTGGEVRAPDVQRYDLWKLERNGVCVRVCVCVWPAQFSEERCYTKAVFV